MKELKKEQKEIVDVLEGKSSKKLPESKSKKTEPLVPVT